MQTQPTANQLTGRATGSLFFTVFGALWIALALYVRQLLTPANITWVLLDFAVLLATAAWVFRAARCFPKVPEDPACQRTFNRINGVQWVAIAVVAFTFGRLHIDIYALSAITAIVGLHMFPLARLFRYPMHYITGATLTGWALISALLIPADRLQGTTALGTGIILWVSAFITLILAATTAQRAMRPARISL